MKVAIVTTRHGAQDDRIYYKQALSLAKRMRVTMIAPDDGEHLDWPADISYVPIPRRNGAIGRLWSVVEATRQTCRENPDVCHVHDLDLVLAIPFLRLLTSARIIYDSHEAYPDQFLMHPHVPVGLRRATARLVELLEKGLVRFAQLVITADEPTRRDFEKTHVPAVTVFNYPPQSYFETEDAKLQAERGHYEGRLVAIYQGTASIDRGLLQMIDAVAIVKASEPRIVLRIVGLRDPEIRRLVDARAEERGVAANLEIVGWLPFTQIAYAMKSSHVGLVPFQPEVKNKKNIPIKIFEYMACGLPMVAADLPSISQYLSQVDVGVLCDSTRPGEIARCVLELLADPERRRRMGENGRQAIRERWNWDKMEEVLFGVYEALGVRWEGSRT